MNEIKQAQKEANTFKLLYPQYSSEVRDLLDLMICEIEGWYKQEYIKELKGLINSIGS